MELRAWIDDRLGRWFPRRRPRGASRRPGVETLEDRCTPSTFRVLNTNDNGPGSLRAAILQANHALGADRIVFAIPTTDAGFVDAEGDGRFDPGDFWKIVPTTALPAV